MSQEGDDIASSLKELFADLLEDDAEEAARERKVKRLRLIPSD